MTWKPGKEIDGPEEIKTIDTPRPCSKCKRLTLFTTKRGRPIHPTCEPDRDWLAEPAYRRAVAELLQTFDVAEVFSRDTLNDRKPSGYDAQGRYIVPPAPYPCAACGTTTDVIRWLPQDVWRCASHGPLNLPVQRWEYRGFPAYIRPVAPFREAV